MSLDISSIPALAVTGCCRFKLIPAVMVPAFPAEACSSCSERLDGRTCGTSGRTCGTSCVFCIFSITDYPYFRYESDLHQPHVRAIVSSLASHFSRYNFLALACYNAQQARLHTDTTTEIIEYTLFHLLSILF
jgi:hypothetical protein